ncbi:MAG: SPOR domain-containing protein [Pseudomonadales bacterium]|nr:SPOR domain-containing protein [Pseudomonadales bacterium]
MRSKVLSILMLPFLMGSAIELEAAQGWVLGSFSEYERAVDEAARLNRALQTEIYIIPAETGGRQLQRLVAPVLSAVDSQDFKRQLGNLGIGNVWLIQLNDKHLEFNLDSSVAERAIPTATESLYYLIVGSFLDVSEAVDVERRLDRHFAGVSSESVLAKGKVFHRVRVGPLAQSDLDSARQQLTDLDYSDSWRQLAKPGDVIAPETVDDYMSIGRYASGGRGAIPEREEIEIPVRGPPPKKRISADGERNLSGSGAAGFNLAVLRRASTVFESPDDRGDSAGRWNSDFSGEYRGFEKNGLAGQGKHHLAFSFQTEYYRSMNDGNDIFAFVPFIRWDDNDNDRSHFDIRELTWVHVGDGWELRSGIRKVFWGVTESQHLVDIINQTDNVENPDGEEKLGQPMINFSLTRDWGVLDFYVLPGFREREYHGREGRLRIPFLVNEDLAVFASGAKTARTDFAVRWSHYIGELELGLSHFSGTSRAPRFQFQPIFDANGTFVDGTLIPVYDVIDQTGLDAQYLVGDWLWKLEAISRSGQGDRYTAATFGFEKSFVGVFDTRVDLGIVTEYLFDDRHGEANAIGDDDFALGVRLTANNVADSSALLVWVWDRNTDEMLTTLEASTRIGSHWKLVLEATIFSHGDRPADSAPGYLFVLMDPKSELGFFQDEDFLKLELTRYF